MTCNDSGYQAITFDPETHLPKVNDDCTGMWELRIYRLALWVKFPTDDILNINLFFLVFPENTLWHFMQNAKACFLEKKISICSLMNMPSART